MVEYTTNVVRILAIGWDCVASQYDFDSRELKWLSRDHVGVGAGFMNIVMPLLGIAFRDYHWKNKDEELISIIREFDFGSLVLMPGRFDEILSIVIWMVKLVRLTIILRSLRSVLIN